MSLEFTFETHPHIFLIALLTIAFHNPKYGDFTPDSPYSGLLISIYIILQFRFLQIPQFLLVSQKIARRLHQLHILPTNSAIVSFSSHLGFIKNEVSLKPSPGGQELICLGYKSAKISATVHPDYSFTTTSKLQRLQLPSEFPNHSKFTTILSRLRTFEQHLTVKQRTPSPVINISNPDFQSCFIPPKPDPNRQWHLIKRFHYELDPALINGHDIHFPDVKNHDVLYQHETIPLKGQFQKNRENLQAGSRCSECGGNHLLKACDVYPENYPLTHPYQKALWDTFQNLPRQSPVPLSEITPAGFILLQRQYQQKINRFWSTFNRLHPHFKNFKFREHIFYENYSRSPLLWAIGAPRWLFRVNLVGVMLPFLKTPVATHIRSSFDPTSESEAFFLQFITEKVPANVIAPFPKRKSRVISQAFAIGLDKTDTQTRPRLVVEFPWLNQHLAYQSFELPTALTTLSYVQHSDFKCLTLDLKSAYWIQPMAKKMYPFVVTSFTIGSHEWFFT